MVPGVDRDRARTGDCSVGGLGRGLRGRRGSTGTTRRPGRFDDGHRAGIPRHRSRSRRLVGFGGPERHRCRPARGSADLRSALRGATAGRTDPGPRAAHRGGGDGPPSLRPAVARRRCDRDRTGPVADVDAARGRRPRTRDRSGLDPDRCGDHPGRRAGAGWPGTPFRTAAQPAHRDRGRDRLRGRLRDHPGRVPPRRLGRTGLVDRRPDGGAGRNGHGRAAAVPGRLPRRGPGRPPGHGHPGQPGRLGGDRDAAAR